MLPLVVPKLNLRLRLGVVDTDTVPKGTRSWVGAPFLETKRKGQFQKKKMTDIFILLRKYENDNILAFKAAHRHQITPLFVKMHGLRN